MWCTPPPFPFTPFGLYSVSPSGREGSGCNGVSNRLGSQWAKQGEGRGWEIGKRWAGKQAEDEQFLRECPMLCSFGPDDGVYTDGSMYL